MAIGGMYQVKNPMETAMQGMSQAAGTYGNMSKNQKTETQEAAKTIGGGVAAGAGGAAAGASIGASMSSGAASGSAGGYWGAAIGAVVGGLAYMLG
jgi:hypothetical protein